MQQYRITTADIIGTPENNAETGNDPTVTDCVLNIEDQALVKELSSSPNKIGFDPKNPTKALSTGDAEGT